MNDPQLAPTAAPVTAKKPRAKRPSEIAAALRKELERKAAKPKPVKATAAKAEKAETKRWRKASKKMHATLAKKPKRVKSKAKAKKPALRRKSSKNQKPGKPGRPSRYDAAGHARMRKLYATGIALDAVGAKMRPSCTGQCVRHIFIRKGWKLRTTRGKNKK